MGWHVDETSGHHVTIGDNAALTLPDGDWTMGGWIKLDDNTGNRYQYFLSWSGFSSDPSFQWFFHEALQADANKLSVRVRDADGDFYGTGNVMSTGTPGTSTAWQHLAAVRSGSTLTQYINGSADGSETDVSVNSCDATTAMYLGMRSDNDPNRRLGGAMAEWAKWDRALSTDELAALAAGWTPDQFPTPVWQLRMWGDEYSEMRVPLTVTNNGSTAADHPGGLIYPSAAIAVPAAAAGAEESSSPSSGGYSSSSTSSEGFSSSSSSTSSMGISSSSSSTRLTPQNGQKSMSGMSPLHESHS